MPARLMSGLSAIVFICAFSLLVSQPVSATVQDLYASPYDLWAGQATAPLVYSDPATSVASFTRDAVEDATLGGCGNYPSDTAVNTYSVWYTFTPPTGGGWLTLSTLQPGTNFDTVLDVWHDSVSAATRVICNDDAVSGDRRSEVSLPVVDTSTYYIAIRRYGNSAMPLAGQTAPAKLAFYARFTTSPEIYVDQTNGSDANPGSITLPVRTIQKGIGLVPAGGTVRVAAGAYGEAVTIGKNVTLIGTGAPTTTSFTLQSGVLGAGSGGISAGAVSVQAGARVVDGILLAAASGTVTVDGPHTETLAIGKSLTLRSTTGAALDSAGTTITVNAGTVTLAGLNLTGTTAALSNAGGTVTASGNWWGSATGPQAATNPAGAGSAIAGAAAYRPWCTVPAPTCTPVGGVAAALAFNPSPNDSTVGTAFTQQPVVEARDAAGNIDTSFTGTITLTLAGGTPGAALQGTASANAVAGVATFGGLSVDKAGTGYTLVAHSGPLNGTSAAFNINKGTPALSFSPAAIAAQTYGAGPIGLTVSSNSTGTLTYSGTPGVCSYDGAQVTITGAGTCTVTANQATDANFTAGSINLSFNVGKATPTLSFTPPAIGTQTPSASPIGLTASSNSTGVFTYSGTVGVCGWNGTQVTLSAVGTCVVTADLAADANYLAATKSLTFTIDKDAPTITFSPASIATQTYGASPIALTASSNSTGVLTYSGTPGVCSYNGTQVTITGAGTCTVYANQAADPTFSAGNAPLSFTVNPASASTTLANQIFTYDGAPHPATFTTTPGGLPTSVTYTGTGGTSYPTSSSAPSGAGTYAVNVSSADPNYQITSGASATLTINPASASTTLANQTFTYNGAPHPATFATTPVTLTTTVTYLGTGGTTYPVSTNAPAGAGTYAVHVASADPNYQITSGTDATLTINKGDQTITFAPLPDKNFGDPSFTLSATASSGLAVSFSATGNCSYTRGRVTITGAGSCTITASQPGDANWNAAPDVVQSFTINKGVQTITFATLRDHAISNPPFTVSASATSGLAVSFSAAGGCSVVGATVTLTGLGTCTITASQPGDADWAAAPDVARSFTVVESFKTFLSSVLAPYYPDLVGSFTLSKATFDAFEPLLITVTITNNGDAPASNFWVDFYINPTTLPTATNQPWDKRCGSVRCKFGLAWYVGDTLAPGQSITLRSVPTSYLAKNTDWPGYFETTKLDLYLYVDSWNPDIAWGAVYERNETNNRAEMHLAGAQGAPAPAALAPAPQALPALPDRPAHPGE
jgi:hypothetical protein